MGEEFIKQFGGRLVSPSSGYSDIKPSDGLSGKYVMIYFSAHWCPPCRKFTPMLIEFYNKLKSKRSDVELVFVSLDKKESEWKDYTSNMPWLCTPFDMPDEEKQKLAGKYGVQGIPHLVVVDGSNGKIITKDGRENVMTDEEGTNFPWKPKTFSEIWPSDLEILSKNGNILSSSIKDKHLMLYFSAHWCPPCRGFTPTLSKAYTTMKGKRDDFELIFVSSDRDQESFDGYWNEMTFCALPFKEREVKNSLSKLFEVQGIPTLVMLGPADSSGNRTLINGNIRSFIESGDFDEFPFHRKNYGDLNNCAENINETKTLIVFHENGDDDDQKEIVDILKKVGGKYSEGTEDEKNIDFLWAFDPSGLAPRVRDLTKVGPVSDDPVMILLDLPDRGAYYVASSETNADLSVESIDKFIKNPGERRQMK